MGAHGRTRRRSARTAEVLVLTATANSSSARYTPHATSPSSPPRRRRACALRRERARDDHAVRQRSARRTPASTRSDLQFTIAGSCDYLSGHAVRVRVEHRRRRRVAAGVREPRRDGRRLGAARGVAAAAARRHRRRDRDRLGQVVARPTRARCYALQTDPYTMAPLGIDPVSLAGIQARAPARRAASPPSPTSPRSSARSRRDALGNPHAQVARDATRRRAARRAVLLGAAAPARPPADLRRRRRGDHRRRRPGRRSSWAFDGRSTARCGSAAWTTGSSRTIPGCATSPIAVDRARPRQEPGVHEGPVDVAELMVDLQPRGDRAARALGLRARRRRRSTSTRRAGRSPVIPVMATGLVRVIEVANRIAAGAARSAASRTRRAGPCLQQNLVCVLEGATLMAGRARCIGIGQTNYAKRLDAHARRSACGWPRCGRSTTRA